MVSPAFDGSGVLQLLDTHGVPPEAILMEITESAVMEELEAAHGALEQLISAGVQILIDDFGTGVFVDRAARRAAVPGLEIDLKFSFRLGADPSAPMRTGRASPLGRDPFRQASGLWSSAPLRAREQGPRARRKQRPAPRQQEGGPNR
jgi:hypothetical protein